MKLYEIVDAYQNLSDLELTEDIKKALDVIKDEFDVKAENIVKVLKNMEADEKALRDEEIRLAEKRRAISTKKENLKEYLFSSMRAIGKPKMKVGIFNINIQKNPQSIKIIDENIIPEKYKIASYRIDKKQLKEDIEEGLKIEGAELVQTEGIRIRWAYTKN